jgi:phage recombination protein Bet
MSNIVLQQQTTSAITALSMNEKELIEVLQTSLYPGAALPSIKMVVSYCRAAQLDPMQKPVHIVPMWDKNAKAMRDVIMPGVGLYRTQAARTGEYAGVSEPEFGPDVTEKVGGIEMTYPKWCKVIVKRLLQNGVMAEFPSVEYWRENYATAGKDSEAPNAMWKKRPYGQIAKCAEAQALRKAFPEIGSQPTAEEMEGKEFSVPADQAAQRPAEPAEVILPDYAASDMEKNLPAWQTMANDGKFSADNLIAKISTRYTLSAAQQAVIRSIKQHVTEQPAEEPEDHADFIAELDQE